MNRIKDFIPNIEDKPTLPLLSKGKQYQIRMDELIINLIRDCNRMTAQEINDVKRKARNLYEELVRLEYEAGKGEE